MKEYIIRSFSLDRARRLNLTEDYIEYENGDLIGAEFTRLNKSEIQDFKHGMEWIVWYKFTVGRKFSITIKYKQNKELKILFGSYFGVHKKSIRLYAEIVENCWKFYHSSIVDKYLEKFYHNEQVEIQKIRLVQSGVRLSGEIAIIPWKKICIKEYNQYFALYHRDNPERHSLVNYNEYGTETLWSLLRTILKEKEVDA